MSEADLADMPPMFGACQWVRSCENRGSLISTRGLCFWTFAIGSTRFSVSARLERAR